MSEPDKEARDGLSAQERQALVDSIFALLEAMSAAQKSSLETRKALVHSMFGDPETARRTLESALSSEMEHDTMVEALKACRKLITVFSGKDDG